MASVRYGWILLLGLCVCGEEQKIGKSERCSLAFGKRDAKRKASMEEKRVSRRKVVHGKGAKTGGG